MQVLIISWEYPPYIDGGLGRHVAELAPALVQQSIDLHIVTPVTELNTIQHTGCIKTSQAVQVSIEQGITVHRVLAPKNDTNADIYERALSVNTVLESYIAEVYHHYGPWDIVHCHDWLTAFAGMALQDNKDFSLVTTIHATERGRWRGHLNNQLQQSIDRAEHNIVSHSNRVIVCSHHMGNELQEFFQASADKLDIVPNGVDLSTLNNDHRDLRVFRANYAAPYQPIVFTVSRLVYEKGVHRLVQAIPRILEVCPSTRIIIAGKGPEAENLKQVTQDLGVADNINFVGFVTDDDRNLLFRVADCAMFPSLYEPFGIVALEAMALGCPVVVSDIGGFAEVVTHTKTGLTTYADNYESVAWGILQALTHPELAQKYATNARKAVEETFTWPKIAVQTKEVYQKAIVSRQ